MGKSMSRFLFRLMSLEFRLRDWLWPPENTLSEAGIKPGFYLLDYGCGPGSYSIAAAGMVGESGKVYALDINPIALQRVQKAASRKGIGNIETICSDCATGLANDSVDVVLLYDTFHDLNEPGRVLEELHRILKPDAFLSFSDHHMTENDILDKVTNRGLFGLSGKGKRTYTFVRKTESPAAVDG